MCSRRNKPVLQAVVFLGLVGSLGYFVYLYNTKSLKLERTDRQLKKYIQYQQSLSSQLKGKNVVSIGWRILIKILCFNLKSKKNNKLNLQPFCIYSTQLT